MTNSAKKGVLFVISGPSGVGKGTLVSMLRKNYPEIVLSISATTRKPRWNEVDGTHYFFLDKEDFTKRVEMGEFLEWAEFSGNLYGTNKNFVENLLNERKNVILEIDVKGALQVKEKISKAVLIFIEPPSLEELKKRLFKRKTDSEGEIQNRLEIVKSELNKKSEFDCVILNDNLSEAFQKLENFILTEIEGVKS